MNYTLDGKEFIFNYQEVKEKYDTFVSLSDEDFMKCLPEIIHSACFISYVKGFGRGVLSDVGIVHELAHLLHLPDETDIKKVRKQFEILKLS